MAQASTKNVVKYKKKVAGKDEHYRNHPTAGRIVVKNPSKAKKPRTSVMHSGPNREADMHESVARYHERLANSPYGRVNKDSYLRQAAHHAKLAEHFRNNPLPLKKKKPGVLKRLVNAVKKVFKRRKKKI